ncbi:hypothetical protein E2C01_019210 [Portunus trituberculatus]|uniref:Uncharacterized protein n=1 Tax=Portunus trituberculatus TaxID=210409 RepID=A0A5B7DX95_PORTR|nr:hypothetical protein [Portunus trituberculatus]
MRPQGRLTHHHEAARQCQHMLWATMRVLKLQFSHFICVKIYFFSRAVRVRGVQQQEVAAWRPILWPPGPPPAIHAAWLSTNPSPRIVCPPTLPLFPSSSLIVFLLILAILLFLFLLFLPSLLFTFNI